MCRVRVTETSFAGLAPHILQIQLSLIRTVACKCQFIFFGALEFDSGVYASATVLVLERSRLVGLMYSMNVSNLFRTSRKTVRKNNGGESGIRTRDTQAYT